MAMFRYFKREPPACPAKVPLLSKDEVRRMNEEVKWTMEQDGTLKKGHRTYNDYTAEERAKIGKYAAENEPARTVRHFSKILDRKLPETTARRLKSEYLLAMKAVVEESKKEGTVPQVSSLPKMAQRRSLLLGQELDTSVQDYINAMRKVGGVVNTAIVMAVANGIIAARSPALLTQHGGHIDITKAWAKSLLIRVGYVKRKCSNARNITVAHFEEVREEFLADIKAEVLMNEIPPQLIFNWNQMAIQLMPTGQWTMHRAKEKVIPIANSDDKRQITAVLAATLTGEYLPNAGNIHRKNPALSSEGDISSRLRCVAQ